MAAREFFRVERNSTFGVIVPESSPAAARWNLLPDDRSEIEIAVGGCIRSP